MNAVKNYTAIHFSLIDAAAFKVEMLMTYLIKYEFQINESNAFTKHLSCKCKCTFHGKNCSLDQW